MSNTFTSVDIAAAFATKPPALDFVFGSFKAGTVGALVAPGATGKSIVALQKLCAVASGYDSTGVLPVKTPGRCVYLSGEDTADIIAHRLYNLGKLLPQEAREAMAANASIIPIVGQSPDILDKTWQDILLTHATGARLLIIDTLRRFHSGDENDSGHMTRVVQALEHIVSLTGCSILFLHHVNKGSMNGGGSEQGASRGSSAITDNIRWQANLSVMSEAEAEKRGIEGDRKRFVKFATTKCNYGTPTEAWLQRSEGGVLIPAMVPEPATKKASKKGDRNASC